MEFKKRSRWIDGHKIVSEKNGLFMKIGWKIPLHPVFKFILLIFFGISLFAVYYFLSYHFKNDSDEAVMPLEAEDILSGNILLRGWTLPADHFYPIDTMFHLVVLLLGGTFRRSMHLVPAIIYTMIVLTSCYLVFLASKEKFSKWEKFLGIISTFFFIAFPIQLAARWVSYSPDHIGTLLYGLIAILFLFRFLAIQSTNSTKISLFFFWFFLFLGNIGDPLSIYLMNIPLILVSLFILSRDQNIPLKIAISKILAIVFLNALLATILHHNYSGWAFSVAGPTPKFVGIENLGHNVFLFFQSVLGLFGADFFGLNPASLQSLSALVHLMVLVFFIVLLISIIKKISNPNDYFQSNSIPVIYLELILVFSIFISFLSFIFSNFPLDIDSSRYLFWVPVQAGILIGINISKIGYLILSKKPLIKIFFILIFMVYGGSFLILEHPFSRVMQPYDPVVKYLLAHNMKEGFGTYWGGNIITVLSNGKIKCRSTQFNGKHIIPYRWASKDDWYKMTHPDFFVFNHNSIAFGVDKNTILRDFGPPSEEASINGYTILYWKHRIVLHGEK